MSSIATPLKFVPSGKALGVDVIGLDISKGISDEDFQQIVDAWYEHLVLRFRGQSINDKHLVDFALRFGQVHHAAGAEYGGKPENLHEAVELVSNIEKDGKPIGALGAGEATWHTDMSMYEIPATATLLYGDEIPPSGGNTRFTNLCDAYDLLDPELKKLVEGRRSIHDAAYLATGGVRPGYEALTDKSKGPGARHPIVRTHPYSGRKALYLGRMGFGYIEGLSVEESDRVLDALWAHMTQPRFIWEQEWKAGDLIVWDNRCVAHARGAFDPKSRRLLRRVTVMDT
ncbi:TauD/TfdA family dioxygenase [Limibacillus sp. MBR-115]|uniref:TauD/TfdA dioxygenase family protein n=1 Tax=Limibacillus sp. MBR-115 TaxID=3156465 RepID=UPI003396B694